MYLCSEKVVKKLFLFIFLSAMLFIVDIYGQNNIFYNPGVKLGYSFGENGGFTYGFELAMIFTDEKSLPGIVLSYEICEDEHLIHLGGEINSIIGVEMGPTFRLSGNENNFGFSMTIYGNLFLIPYYRYTRFSADNDYSEVGAFIKVTTLFIGYVDDIRPIGG